MTSEGERRVCRQRKPLTPREKAKGGERRGEERKKRAEDDRKDDRVKVEMGRLA